MRKEFKLAAAFITAMCLTAPASADQDPDKVKLGINNASHELVQCSAYFLIVSIALENSQKTELAGQYKDISEKAFLLASKAAEVAGLMKEVTASRFQWEFTDMTKRINSNTSNISILGNDYAEPCQNAVENSSDRLRYWVDKVTSE